MTEQQRAAFVVRCVRRLQKLLLLQQCELSVRFREMDDGDLATSNAQAEYRQAALRFNIYDERMDNEEFLLRVVCHELAHVVLDPLYTVASNLSNGDTFKQETTRIANETVTTHWEQVLFLLVKDDLLDA